MNLKTLTVLVVLGASVTFSGCGFFGDTGCDFREVDEDGLNNGPEDRCQERRGLQGTGFGATCEGLGAKAVTGGCPREGIVAGCEIGADVIDWYYEPMTRAEVEDACRGDKLVEP